MKYIYIYNDTIFLETNDIKPLNETIDEARVKLGLEPDENKIKCYQKIY